MLLAEEVVELVVGEEGFQHPLQEDEEEALVEALVLEHVEDVHRPLPDGLRAQHRPHLVCHRHKVNGTKSMSICIHAFTPYFEKPVLVVLFFSFSLLGGLTWCMQYFRATIPPTVRPTLL